MAIGSESFLQKIEQVLDGEVSSEVVLRPLLDGLDPLLVNLEQSLEHVPEAVLDQLEPCLDAISVHADELRDLLDEGLEPKPSDEILYEIGEAHERLNDSLLRFHREIWIARGPTSVDWVNRAVLAVERFLQGDTMDGRLSGLLANQVLELEIRLAVRPCESGRAVAGVARELSRWAQGQDMADRQQLQDWIAVLVARTESSDPNLFREKMSLARLLSILDPDQSEPEREYLIGLALTDLRDLQFVIRRKSSQVSDPHLLRASSRVSDRLTRVEGQLSILQASYSESTLATIVEQREDLEAELEEFESALEGDAEESVATDSDRQRARIDYLESHSGGEPEQEHVQRLRLACEKFQGGVGSISELQAEVGSFQARLIEVKRSPLVAGLLKTGSSEGRTFLAALELLSDGLETLAQCTDPSDHRLTVGLETVHQGVGALSTAEASE